MLEIKARYQDGKIFLLNDIPDKIKTARLTIVVEPDDQEKNNIHPQGFVNSETEFKATGLLALFDEDNDKNINWEDYFGLK